MYKGTNFKNIYVYMRRMYMKWETLMLKHIQNILNVVQCRVQGRLLKTTNDAVNFLQNIIYDIYTYKYIRVGFKNFIFI